MRILVIIGHPAHVHVFKNFIKEMQAKGHECLAVARGKECTFDLLKAEKIKYVELDIHYKSMFGKALGLFRTDWGLYKIAKKFKPDVFLGVLDPYIAHVGKWLGKPSINLVDTEHSKLQNWLAFPFNDVMLTPDCYYHDLGPKQVRYNGYHELAYVHPNRFTPDKTAYKKFGLKKPYHIVRLVSWDAAHDVGIKGLLTLSDKKKIIEKLEQSGRVYISAEKELPAEFEKYRIPIPPERFLDVLSTAKTYVGDGATMASEAALLGVPSLYMNPLPLGYIDDLQKSGLLLHSTDVHRILKCLDKWGKDAGQFPKKLERLLKTKVDVTSFLVDFVLEFMKKQDVAVKDFFSDQAKSWEKQNYRSHNLNTVTFQDRADKVRSLMKTKKGDVVLEVGCGPGIFIDGLLKNNLSVYGMDVSAQMVAQAKKKYPKAHVAVGDIRSTGFSSNKFNLVLAVGVLPYLFDDDVALKEIHRIVKKGGEAILTFNKASGLNYRLRSAFGGVARLFGKRHSDRMIFKNIKLNAHKRKALLKLLSKNGFRVVDVVESNYKLLPFSSIFPRFFVWFTKKKRSKRSVLANEIIVKVIKR